MDFDLNETHKAFRQEVREFFDARLPDDIHRYMSKGYVAKYEHVRRWQRILQTRGWAAPHWPKEYGGAGLGEVERLILLEETYRKPAPLPLNFNINMLGTVLLKFGTPQQKADFLPKLANLDLWFCQGFSEPNAGSDLASLRTSARREGDSYIINGQKIWTTTAHVADWIFCLVRTDSSGRKQDGISFLLIDLRSPGITIRPIRSIDNEHHFNEVFFDEVRVPAANLVGAEGEGWACAKYLLSNERTGIAHIGLCKERLRYARTVLLPKTEDNAHAYLREIIALECEVRALEITQWRLLNLPAANQGADSMASKLKLRSADLQQAITSLMQRMAGPATLERRSANEIGNLHWACAIGPRYIFLRAATIFGGSSEIQREIIANKLLGT